MKTQHVSLAAADKTYLQKLVAKGSLPAKVFKRATALLEVNRAKPLAAVAESLGVSYQSVSNWCNTYNLQGLGMLQDQPRSGRPIQIDGAQRAKITALACSKAPKGHSRWSLRLLADRAVELGYCEHLSHNHAGNLLKKMR
jgi:putative transposase